MFKKPSGLGWLFDLKIRRAHFETTNPIGRALHSGLGAVDVVGDEGEVTVALVLAVFIKTHDTHHIDFVAVYGCPINYTMTIIHIKVNLYGII